MGVSEQEGVMRGRGVMGEQYVSEGVIEDVMGGDVLGGGASVSDWNTFHSPSKYFFMISSISC